MNVISLRNVIDDILLLVRNNNISESEDLSREQIAQWVKAHKAAIKKQELDSQNDDNVNEDEVTGESVKEEGPLELENVESLTRTPLFTKKTIDKIERVYKDDERSILSVVDQEGCNIQKMNKVRRHLHYFRRYTADELTYYYEDGYIYIQGVEAYNNLRYIWVTYLEDDTESDDGKSEDDVKIPTWMVPTIKERIFKSELAFMLRLPSDDSNNATLASVKPHGPQDQEE